MRASSVGTARPVTVVEIDDVDVGRLEAGVVERAEHRGTAEFDGVFDEDVVGRAEVVEPGVLLQRQHHVPAVDLRAPVQLPDRSAYSA